ncbi:MAG: alpha/beta fold hydrolase [Acidocella sp.]|nr:alpha/beta fold hydrolase [Acidocella sp.]
MQASGRNLAAEQAASPKPRAGQPDWARDGWDWPNRGASRFVHVAGQRWHVQIAGDGPVLLLLHGTGAATHSWRDMLPRLAQHFTVVAPDLPGHGFTSRPADGDMSLPGMARGVAGLLAALGMAVDFAAGHSAGVAILVRMCLDGMIAPGCVVSLNGAMLPYGGAASALFAPLARGIARNPLLPVLFAWRAADTKVVERLLRATGSALDPIGLKFYARLARHSAHTGAALAMMGNWELTSLVAALPTLPTRLVLVVGENDRSIPPGDAKKLQAILPTAEIISLPGLGHLAHEEKPVAFSDLIREHCR